MHREDKKGALVKPIAGILTAHKELLGTTLDEMSKYFGGTDLIANWYEFKHSAYYNDEMGAPLFRTFVSFDKLIPPWNTGDFKVWTKEIEAKFAKDGKRSVNIDAGYIDENKVVLVSGKGGGHKIAIGEDVYADMLLWYNKQWVAFPWAFPDFRDGSLFPTFMKMRRKFKEQKAASSASSEQ